jgi:hypothetical protein
MVKTNACKKPSNRLKNPRTRKLRPVPRPITSNIILLRINEPYILEIMAPPNMNQTSERP